MEKNMILALKSEALQKKLIQDIKVRIQKMRIMGIENQRKQEKREEERLNFRI